MRSLVGNVERWFVLSAFPTFDIDTSGLYDRALKLEAGSNGVRSLQICQMSYQILLAAIIYLPTPSSPSVSTDFSALAFALASFSLKSLRASGSSS
jgi:hypothetical protein